MAEGRNIQIPFLGIVRNTPGALGRDGEMEEMVNLRPEDGALRPIPDRTQFASVTGYSALYVHSNAGFKHLLGVSSGSLFYIGDISGSPYTALSTPVSLCPVSGPASFTQIGNVVNLLDSTGVKYLIWYENGYVYIDKIFDDSQQTTAVGPGGRIDLRVKGITNPDGVRQVRQYYTDATFKITSGTNQKDSAKEAVKGLIRKAISTDGRDGRLTGFFLACTAIELYDGSYILHSNPVLLAAPWDRYTRYTGLALGSSTWSYDNNPMAFDIGENQNVFMDTSGEHNQEEQYYVKHMNTAYPHAGDEQFTSREFPNMLPIFTYTYGSSTQRPVFVVTSANELQFRISQSVDPALAALIKSVSVFITREVSPLDLEGNLTERELDFAFTGNNDLGSYQWLPTPKANEAIVKELMNQPGFYKVHEIPFEEITAGDWITIDLDSKLGDSLLTQEVLPIDPLSHHTFKPQYQFVYNSKLHIANYNVLLSRGWPLNYFESLPGVGQFPGNESFYSSTSNWYCEVTIKTETGETKVVRYSLPEAGLTIADLNAIISYPDRRATRISIYRFFDNNDLTLREQILTVALKAHEFHNFAYFISPDLKPLPFPDSVEVYQPQATPGEFQRDQVFTNAFKVSEINNPFTFPLSTTYRVGSGTILAMASNAQAISTGQFGEYPLLVFHTGGIDAMYVAGGEITYSASRPLARDVCSNPGSVKAIDGGVVFATQRGLMVISGAQVNEISAPVEGAPLLFLNPSDQSYLQLFSQAVSHASLVALSNQVSLINFRDYMQGAIFAYNYKKRELWSINPTKAYAYIYTFAGGWTKTKETAPAIVEDYPLTYLHKTGELIDISSESTTHVPVMFLTRPIKLGTLDFKQTYRAVIRGLITTAPGKYAGMYLFGSYDGIKWAFLGGSEMTGQIKDIGTTVERVDCKYFRIGFVGELTPDSALDYIEVSAKARLTGKLR
jgi:hypothetical protein